MAIVILFRWLAAFAARLATVHGYAALTTRPTGGDLTHTDGLTNA